MMSGTDRSGERPADRPGGQAGGAARPVLVGAIVGAFGVRGEVRLKSFCAEPAAIADYGPLTGRSPEQRFEILSLRPIKGGFAARIRGIETREQAEALRGTPLHVPRERLPETGEEEYYHADLIGLEVVDPGGARLGRVVGVHDFGAGDLLEIAMPGRRQTVLAPFTREVVPTVDLAAGRIVLDAPEGLLD